MPAGSLVTRYLAGLALGAALVAGYVAIPRLLAGPSALPSAPPTRVVLPAPPPEPVKDEEPPRAEAPLPPVADDGLPASCNDYRREVTALIACEKVPAATRDAMRNAMRAMSDAWGNIARMSTSESRAQLATACVQATDAIRQTSEAMGCR